jgi:hypothetical protein
MVENRKLEAKHAISLDCIAYFVNINLCKLPYNKCDMIKHKKITIRLRDIDVR